MTKLREIKKEIRVLGLASSKKTDKGTREVVAVVFRGKHWLDGVMRISSKALDITMDVVRMIRSSNHHPQIRVILLSRDLLPCIEIDLQSLSEETGKPVIALGFKVTTLIKQNNLIFFEWSTAPVITIGINEKTAKRVLSASTRKKKYPEALRVAGLLSDSFRQN